MFRTFAQSSTRGLLVAMVSLFILTGCKRKPEASKGGTEGAATEQESLTAPASLPATAEEKRIEIGVNKGIVLQPQFAVTRAVLNDPEIASARVHKPSQVVISGARVGQTQLTLTGSNGQAQVYEVHVVAKVPPTANVIRIALGAKTTIETNVAIALMTSFSAGTAEVQSVSNTAMTILGRTEGETQVFIFTVDDRVLIYDVIVTKDTGP